MVLGHQGPLLRYKKARSTSLTYTSTIDAGALLYRQRRTFGISANSSQAGNSGLDRRRSIPISFSRSRSSILHNTRDMYVAVKLAIVLCAAKAICTGSKFL